MSKTKQIGFGIQPPQNNCEDSNCPFHGTLKVRGKDFVGKVISDKMQKSVTIMWLGWRYIPKYERYKRTRTKITAHNPPCINAVEGDIVKVVECRPLSKTKNFVVVQMMGKEGKYALEKEAVAEGKHKEKPKSAQSSKESEKENVPEE